MCPFCYFTPSLFSLSFSVIQKLLFYVRSLLTVSVTQVCSFVSIVRWSIGGNIFQLFSSYYISCVRRIKSQKIFG